jgi:adenylate cyclase|tara:strand:+ start:762 stop:1946 length:1185 start_codon:yes stop_codon:yes gene_type:complete
MKFLQKAFNKHLVNKITELGHKPAPKPENEESRLKDIKDLKIIEENIDKSKRFSSFPRLAAALTECDKAAINIVDDTVQHCKVNYGMDVVENMMMKEIPRELSICAHVLNNASKPLVINDLTKDSRTKHVFELDNPIINKSFPKFYAGSPIITSNGYILGSFCVFNSEPKLLDNSKIEGLRMLADQFIDLYESTKDEYKKGIKSNHTKEEKVSGEYFSSSTVLFCDFVGFTKKTEKMQPGELVEILDTFFNGFDKIIERFELKKVKTIGDAYMAVGGIPDLNSNHAERVVLASKEIINFVTGINFQQEAIGNESWHVRIGIHSGPVIAGNTSSNFDIWGDTVNIASRLESSGEVMKINISEEVKKLLPSSFNISNQKTVHLKNKGDFEIYSIDF